MRPIVSATIRPSVAALLLTIVSTPLAAAQDQATEIRAVTFIAPPFAMKQGDQLSGFCIDLWNEIAARLKIKTNYQLAPDISSVIEAMRSKTADVLVGPVFYTIERDQEFDFSYPILEAGQQVLVLGSGASGSPTPLRDVVALLFLRSAMIWLGVILILILIPSHLIWLLDRGHEDGISPSKRYFPGIFQAMFWAASALASQAEKQPGRWLARVAGLLWMFAGIVVVALYTAQLTATVTVEQIQGAISGPADLPGKQVATIANSTAVEYLRKIGAQVQGFQTADEMFAALLNRTADAVLSSAPALRYYAAHDGLGRASVVGPEINRDEMGFLFQLSSPLRRSAGTALIALREDGTYQRIYEKWFGSD
jgi:polar amino acid transport system substrate-binding protein